MMALLRFLDTRRIAVQAMRYTQSRRHRCIFKTEVAGSTPVQRATSDAFKALNVSQILRSDHLVFDIVIRRHGLAAQD
jgi:hypothetical protein